MVGVVSLDDFAADFASSGNPVDPFVPVGFAEELPNVVPQAELVPVHVVVAAAVGVARGDDLNIVVLQHRQQLADALRAHANVSDGQFVARGDEVGSSQNMARNDGKSGGGGGGRGEECAAILIG